MSNFTIKPPCHTAVVSLREGGSLGQVDIMVSAPDGSQYRVAGLGHGKLQLFRLSTRISEQIGLELDSGGYPVIGHII